MGNFQVGSLMTRGHMKIYAARKRLVKTLFTAAGAETVRWMSAMDDM